MFSYDHQAPSAEKMQQLEAALLDVVKLFQSLDLQYYLQCSAALLFYGISLGENYDFDIDMRVLAPGVKAAAAIMQDAVPPEAQTWFGVEDKGRALIATPHFQFTHNNTEVDIAADMRFIVDGYIDIEIPNDPEWFDYANQFMMDDGTIVRVASIEQLLIYYLVIERSKDTGKMDLQKIAKIAACPSFDYPKFYALMHRFFTPQGRAAINEIVQKFATRTSDVTNIAASVA